MILNINFLKEEIARIRKENPGAKIVTTNGSFDILHIGHILTLEKAKRIGDVLVVLLNSDQSIKKLKGNNRPIVPEKERARILSFLKPVDYVIIFNEDKPLNYLAQIKPDIHVKGGSFIQERIEEEEKLLASWGGILKTFPLEKDHSTTNLINKILGDNK